MNRVSAGLAALVVGLGFVVVGDAVRAEPWSSTGLGDHPLVGRVWQVAGGRFVSPDTVFAAATAAHYVALGETHDNADHHRIQAAILAVMTAGGRRPAVVFEQIPRDLQPALDLYRAENPGNAAGLGDAVQWQARGWPAWALYQPIANAAMIVDLPLLAGDIPEAPRKQVGRGGLEALPEADRQRMLLDRPLPAAQQAAVAQEMVDAHCGLIPAAATAPLAAVQRARDGWLADALIDGAAQSGDGAVLIAGGGHVRLDRAVPWALHQRQPQASVVVVAMQEVRAERTDPASYDAAADYLWFTPAALRADPCVALRARMQKG
jgi:uncharacterized iron-regulated protein